MTHPLVTQLRFARSELMRGLEGLTTEEAEHRFMPMNSISWMVGHLANQEHGYWIKLAQGKNIAPDLNNLVGYGKPASTPPWDEILETWQQIIAATDEYLDTITAADLDQKYAWRDKEWQEDIGTLLLRIIFHYWYHIGEIQAVRQNHGHTTLPDFVGDDMSSVKY
ncbi:MAG: DinB family protein [Anaerolineales bacterium]|uniref:DinB family protein n=1 Tax=Candidatus Desulfolinea nitratireducens TaxID=2841698 RepID=A0A8J6NEM4_9CHLR|nr:DinB family protein [Candidatus Desulfolinea nitratireducens]MBL6960017.1 DinB family protein [Anaerolineales bacterium]